MVAVDIQSSRTTTARTSQKPAKFQFSNKITYVVRADRPDEYVEYVKYRVKARS